MRNLLDTQRRRSRGGNGPVAGPNPLPVAMPGAVPVVVPVAKPEASLLSHSLLHVISRQKDIFPVDCNFLRNIAQ
jgi:hypothetical protein